MQNLLGGDEAMARSRSPELMADAAHAIVTRPSRETTGNFFLAEDVLAEEGVDDLSAYSYGGPDAQLVADLFVTTRAPPSWSDAGRAAAAASAHPAAV